MKKVIRTIFGMAELLLGVVTVILSWLFFHDHDRVAGILMALVAGVLFALGFVMLGGGRFIEWLYED